MATVKTSLTELPESRVRIDAEVPAAEIERRLQQAAKQLGRQMRIPGFRKGKVPPPVVIRRLGREMVLDEALRSSLGSWYADAIHGAGIAPIGEPELNLEELPAEGQPLAFSIEIGVRPRAKLGRYKGLAVGRREPRVQDADLQAELERLRDRSATLETVERPAAIGDYVVIHYVGRIGEEPFEGGEGRDQLLELGSGRPTPDFDAQLVGAAAGDQRVFDTTFPDAYPGELGGKQATFEVTVSEVKAKRLAELDDRFAAEAAGFDTLAELREDIAARLTEADKRNVEREFESAVIDAVVSEAQIEVPTDLVHARAHEMVGQMLAAVERQGIPRTEYVRMSGQDEEALVHEAEAEAVLALRREAVLAAVIEAERIEPSEEDLLEALLPAAESGNTSAEQLLEQLRAGDRIERLREELTARRALELLVREAEPIALEQAQAREKLWTPDKQEESPTGPGRIWTPGS
jgi:trigger factor